MAPAGRGGGVVSGAVLLSSLDAWLGLDRLSLTDPDASLGWVHPLPAWGWGLVVLAAVLLAAWSYTRMLGSPWVRGPLAVLRGVTLVAIAVLLAGPELTRTDERVEPDWVLVLVDRSASMQVRDVASVSPGDAATATGAMSRDEQLAAALDRHREALGDAGLAEKRVVRWLGFADRARAIDSPWIARDNDTPANTGDRDAVALPPPDGRPTHLRTALDQALDLAQGRPLSGVVILSDGRSPEAVGPEMIRRLTGRLAGVYAVPLGAADPPRDLAVASVESPREAFVDDVVPVTVSIDVTGGISATGADPLAGAVVRLVDPSTPDPATGEPAVLDERPLDGVAAGGGVRLSARAEATGPIPWKVEVIDAASSDERGNRNTPELVTANNTAEVETAVIDRPLRVLYVEAYPRWEFRYLKNLLIREQSVEVSTMLLSADRAFAQEGDRPITRLPETREELRGYDAVILGDVPADALGLDRLELLRDHVAERGAGMLWIGGVRSTPASYAATPLADLLPMQSPGAVAEAGAGTGEGLTMMRRPLAASLSVMQLRDAAGEAVSLGDLPPLRYVQRVGPIKPAAEVLAVASADTAGTSAAVGGEAGGEALPAVLRMRFGAGQVLYVATDETWRWRYGRGEVLFEQFWIQLVRLLARGRVEQLAQPTTLSVSDRRIDLGQSLVIELTTSDPAVLTRDLDAIDVNVLDADDPTRAITGLTLRRQTDPVEARRTGQARYRAVWRPASPGERVVRVSEAGFDGERLSRPVDVRPTDVEAREPAADHAKLAALAEATGGAVVPADSLDRLVDLIPARPRRTPVELRESLWDSWAAFMLVLGLLILEWLGRKLIRLV